MDKVLQKLLSNIKICKNSCWLWQGGKNGLGGIRVGLKTLKPYRLSYLRHRGMIPKNWVVKSTCEDKSCINPDHLYICDGNAYKRIDPLTRLLNGYKEDKVTGCWEWQKAKDKDGYGQITIFRKSIKAHRFSYMQHNGMIPKSWMVCHKCHNPKCINPKHLFVGTNSDNMLHSSIDKRLNCNHQLGEKNPYNKLKEATVKRVYQLSKEEKTSKYISEITSVPMSNVRNIRYGYTWSHITGHVKC